MCDNYIRNAWSANPAYQSHINSGTGCSSAFRSSILFPPSNLCGSGMQVRSILFLGFGARRISEDTASLINGYCLFMVLFYFLLLFLLYIFYEKSYVVSAEIFG